MDALILLGTAFDAGSIHPDGRLAVVARFGVGYDSVDVEACTAAGVAVTITPDGVRRPVATSILGFLLALSLKLVQKNRLARLGAEGFEQRSAFMGEGLVGKTLGYANPTVAAELGVTLVDLPELFRRSDYLAVNCPLVEATAKIVNAERLGWMKPTASVGAVVAHGARVMAGVLAVMCVLGV